MEWTLEKLDKLKEQIEQLYQTTELSSDTLADVMGKIDTERFKINQANGVTTRTEPALHKHVVTNCPSCGGETTFLEPDKCMTADCPNCIF